VSVVSGLWGLGGEFGKDALAASFMFLLNEVRLKVVAQQSPPFALLRQREVDELVAPIKHGFVNFAWICSRQYPG